MSNAVKKNGSNRLAWLRFVTNLQFVSNATSAKHNVMGFACPLPQHGFL